MGCTVAASRWAPPRDPAWGAPPPPLRRWRRRRGRGQGEAACRAKWRIWSRRGPTPPGGGPLATRRPRLLLSTPTRKHTCVAPTQKGTPVGVVNRARGPALGSWEDRPPAAAYKAFLGCCPQPQTTPTLSPLFHA
eukprot:1187187-Prorocentrum_minimum.AAC.2